MSINFSKNVEQYTTAQRNTRVKHFIGFASKKDLESSGVLNDTELDFVKSIKGTFNFALHEDKRYMAVTLYKANADKKYTFLVVDLKEKAIAEADSIKQAKIEILNLVGEVEQTEDAPKSSDKDAESGEKKSPREKKSKKKEVAEEADKNA